jgi:hypothetical protein
MRSMKTVSLVLLLIVVGSLVLVACGGGTDTPPAETTPPISTTPGETTPPPADGYPRGADYEWPKIVYLSASGSSGMAKYVSWTSLLENDTGMKVRVIPEENSVSRYEAIASGKMFIAKAGKREMANVLEATENHAVRSGGPFQVRSAWVHALSNSGMFVRGDSDIYTMDDIKPGIRWSVWAETFSVLKVPKAILDWAEVPHDQVQFVNSGSYEAAVRAVMDGRADIFWGFPTSPVIYEASAAPQGIRYISMNSDEDPEGAARFNMIDPLYDFGPIQSGVEEARGVWGTQGYTMEISSDVYDPAFVYNMAYWIDGNYDRFVAAYGDNKFMSYDYLQKALAIHYIPVHDGLKQFLIDKGDWGPVQDARQEANQKKLDIWIAAYDDVIKLAESQGMKVDPTNEDWIDFWFKYQADNDLPRFFLYKGWDDTRWRIDDPQ